MIFKCIKKSGKKFESWNGEIKNIKDYGNYYEAIIISRSSLFVVFGITSRGGFLCVPDFNKGCHLVTLSNSFWNKEKLIEILGEVDGLTVFFALYEFSKYYK
jgi:hypothetical protein